jgi:hypothetical protein
MNKQRLAQILTFLILLGVLVFTVAGRSGWNWRGIVSRAQPADATPEDAIYNMLDAARNGDVKKYMAAYNPSMQTALRQSITDSSDSGFRRYLQDTNATLKGVAVMPPEKTSDTEVKVRVEYVYQDRNEAQTMYLEKSGSGWRIARVETAQRVKTLVPYGTPVR